MCAFSHLDSGRGRELVCLLFQFKSFQAALSGGVDVIDHPGAFCFTFRSCPLPLTNAHLSLRKLKRVVVFLGSAAIRIFAKSVLFEFRQSVKFQTILYLALWNAPHDLCGAFRVS
ncbi:hypothetical protein D3C87_1682950 [compost metagenome]